MVEMHCREGRNVPQKLHNNSSEVAAGVDAY